MENAVALKTIESLRENFRQVVGKNRKKLFEKKRIWHKLCF